MQLYINDIEVDLNDRIPFPLTYQISDIKDASSRKGNRSKTISIPGTVKNVQLMSNVFVTSNTDKIFGGSPFTGNFDPSKKATARYYDNGIQLFNGVCQLLECRKTDGEWTFDLVLFSEVIDYMSAFKNYKINELGWDEYNHVYTRANQVNSWSGVIKKNGSNYSNLNSGGTLWLGEGYYYGLIDHGFQRPQEDSFPVDVITPSVFIKTILDKLFEKAEISYTSSFFQSQRFKKLLLAYEGGVFPKVDSTVANNASVQTDQINPSTGGFFLESTAPLTDSDYDGIYYSTNGNFVVDYSSNSATDIDVENQVQSSVPLSIVVKNEGQYVLSYSGTHNIDETITHPNGSGSYQTFYGTILNLLVKVNGVQYSADTIWSYQVSSTALTYSTNVAFTFTKDLYLNCNDVVEFELQAFKPSFSIPMLIDAGGYLGIATHTMEIEASTCALDLNYVQQNIIAGSTINLKQFLPTMDGATFFKGLVNMFNLYIKIDPEDATNLLIEPLNDFYGGSNNAVQWSEYVDYTKEWKVTPTINLTSKEYFFGFQDDKDYWNERYFVDVNRQYGSKTLVSPSQFAKGKTEVKLPFSCKILQNIPNTNLIMPRNFTVKTDESGLSQVVPKRGKPYIVQIKSGTPGTLQDGEWYHIDENDVAHFNTQYPYVGHLDNIDNPTFDLTFNVPNFVFYEVPNNTAYTTNNLYLYHERFIKEVLSKNGKVLTCAIRLNPNLVNTLDFGQLINIEGVVYRLQKINDYDSNNDDSTICEFVRIVEGEEQGSNTIKGTELFEDPYDIPENIYLRITENNILRATEDGLYYRKIE